MDSQQLFLAKINDLLQCNPQQCRCAGCHLYYEEKQMCDAERFIKMFNVVMKEKFEQANKTCYDPNADEEVI